MDKKYLLIVRMGDSEYIEALNVLNFVKKKEMLPVIKQDGRLYVEGSTDAEKLLTSTGHGFIRGTLSIESQKVTFTRAVPVSQVQLLVGNLKEIEVPEDVMKMDIQTLEADVMLAEKKLSDVISKRLSTKNLQVVAFGKHEIHSNSLIFEIYQGGIGQAKAVNIIEREMGLCRIRTRQEISGSRISLRLEPRYSTFEL